MNTITIIDCTGTNLQHVAPTTGPKMAGYVTGTNGVAWSPEQFATHPDAIRIDQSPFNTPADETADVIDMEQDAATLTDLPNWCHAARANFAAVARPGQRSPLIYQSRSNVTPVANTLVKAGITSGIGLWVAQEMDSAQAVNLVNTASGPFPIIGVQYAFQGLFDVSVFNEEWFNAVSRHAPAPISKPGVMGGWEYCNKCQGLFFGPRAAISHCPAGGPHNGVGSHSFTLGFDQ